MISYFHWPYYTLRDGRLYDEKNVAVFPEAPRFADVSQAEDWLHTYDLRGNVRSDWCTPMGDRLGDADY